jgi:hypothetical protein
MLTPINAITGGDEEDARLLREMAVKARDFIMSFKWSLPIRREHFVDGFGGVVAIFLFEFDGKIGGTDDRLWVFVGDLPSVYMIVELPTNAQELLEGYCELMDDWVNAVLVTRDFNGVYPVDAAETPGNGEDLRNRLDFLRRELIPHFSDEPIELS